MKNLIILLLNWFSTLLKAKKQVSKQTFPSTTKIIEPVKEFFNPISRPIPKHNNRKRTPGRRIQEIKIGNHSRFIYHTY